jgi:hypothetical protein
MRWFGGETLFVLLEVYSSGVKIFHPFLSSGERENFKNWKLTNKFDFGMFCEYEVSREEFIKIK